MIDIQNLQFKYPKQPPLFNELRFNLQPGSITGLLGKNGAGKTTLLKMITGLLHPHAGSVLVADHQPRQRQPTFLQQIFLVPEEFYLPPISIRQFIKSNSGFYPSFDHKIIRELIAEFELSDDRQIHRLSYGQKKKFLIAFALATRCPLLIMDEPTNGLDIPSKSIFRKVLASSLGDNQLVVISTHQVKDIETLIDRVFILNEGQVILDKEISEIASRLRFTNSMESSGADILYSELGPGGYRVIKPEAGGNSSGIDLELLFNACCNGIKLFNTK